jgi:hypothetical protein
MCTHTWGRKVMTLYLCMCVLQLHLTNSPVFNKTQYYRPIIYLTPKQQPDRHAKCWVDREVLLTCTAVSCDFLQKTQLSKFCLAIKLIALIPTGLSHHIRADLLSSVNEMHKTPQVLLMQGTTSFQICDYARCCMLLDAGSFVKVSIFNT